MAKINYGYAKRQRELAKKQKREEKQQRKAEKSEAERVEDLIPGMSPKLPDQR